MATRMSDPFELRATLLSVPKEAVEEIGKLWNAVSSGYDIHFDTEVQRIAKEHKLPVEVVELYYDFYAAEPDFQAVIFYDKRAWLDGIECFGVRFYNQERYDFLPKGTFLCGMISETGAFLNPPAVGDSTLQTQNLLKCLQQGLLAVKELGCAPHDILSERIIRF